MNGAQKKNILIKLAGIKRMERITRSALKKSKIPKDKKVGDLTATQRAEAVANVERHGGLLEAGDRAADKLDRSDGRRNLSRLVFDDLDNLTPRDILKRLRGMSAKPKSTT